MSRPVIDHRSEEFAELALRILGKTRLVFGTESGTVVLYPASGTGAWEAALVNTLSPGDRVLAFESGHFSAGFGQTASALGLNVDTVSLPWGNPVTGDLVMESLRKDHRNPPYRALLVVHNETSTGVRCHLEDIRAALDETSHDALLLVDAVSSLASMPVRFDEWGIDVCISASQKGLMLPPGMGVICISERTLAMERNSKMPRHFFDWEPMIRENKKGYFPYTPPTNLMYGLDTALKMILDEEGLPSVYARHQRLAEGVRAAVSAWGMEMVSRESDYHSDTTTAVWLDSISTGDLVGHARDVYGLSLGGGLGLLSGKAFRIGHLGYLGELEVLAILGGIEMSLAELGLEVVVGSGVAACQASFLAYR